MTDDEPTEEELREAEALARALERGQGQGVPGDALQAAAFLRFAKDEGALDGARAADLLQDAMARARRPVRASRKAWFLGALGLSAAGVATWLTAVNLPEPGAKLPPPPASLLSAQLDAATNRAANLNALRTETEGYRTAVYAALKERYRP
jgi:hypothetical protein